MSSNDTNLFMKKLKLVVLFLIIAFFNLAAAGGFLEDLFDDCDRIDTPNAEDKADEAEAITLTVTIVPNAEELTVDPPQTKTAVATASCSPDPCSSFDFFRWVPGSGEGVTAGLTSPSGQTTRLRFTSVAEDLERDSVTPTSSPTLGEGNLGRPSFAQAIAQPISPSDPKGVKGVKVARGGQVKITLLLPDASAESELGFFPALFRLNILFSPSSGTPLNFGTAQLGTASQVKRSVYMVNKTINVGTLPCTLTTNVALINHATIFGEDAIHFTSGSAGNFDDPTEIPVPIADSCLGGIGGFDSVTFPLQFFPETAGDKEATLVINYSTFKGLLGEDVPNFEATYTLRGTGTE